MNDTEYNMAWALRVCAEAHRKQGDELTAKLYEGVADASEKQIRKVDSWKAQLRAMIEEQSLASVLGEIENYLSEIESTAGRYRHVFYAVRNAKLQMQMASIE